MIIATVCHKKEINFSVILAKVISAFLKKVLNNLIFRQCKSFRIFAKSYLLVRDSSIHVRGCQKGVQGCLGTLDVEIWYFPITFLLEKRFSFSLELVKWNSTTVGLLLTPMFKFSVITLIIEQKPIHLILCNLFCFGKCEFVLYYCSIYLFIHGRNFAVKCGVQLGVTKLTVIVSMQKWIL